MIRCLNIYGNFCGMKFYKEIAHFMKIKIPIMNQNIPIKENQQCIVHGVKKINQIVVYPLEKDRIQSLRSCNVKSNLLQQKDIEVNIIQKIEPFRLPSFYTYSKYSQQNVSFSQALSISKDLLMDLTLMKEQTKQSLPLLSISNIKHQIYTQYFQKHLNKKQQSYKTIRISQKIERNDIKNKINNIIRMRNRGDNRFKIVAMNDSEKSQEMIIAFGECFDIQIQPYIETFKNKFNRKQQRWAGDLIFEKKGDLDIDKINKKWRRQKIQEQKSKIDNSKQQIQNFTNDSIQMQSELFDAYKILKFKMPRKYQILAQDEQNVQKDKYTFYRSIENDEQDEQDRWDEQQEQKFNEKMNKFNKQHFGQQTVQEIINEMQKLKRSGYQSQAHKVARFRALKQQLQEIAKRNINHY